MRDTGLGDDVPDLLERQAGDLADEQEAPDQFSEEGEARWRRRLGKIVYVATDVIGAAGSVASLMAFGETAAGQAMLAQLGEAWKTLMSLTRFGG